MKVHSLITACLAILPGIALGQNISKPNIVVILLDDAGYNDFGFMGKTDIETPNIDKLAACGTIFSDAHVSATVSSPSRAGLLTGRYQQRFGHECNLDDTLGMDPKEKTVADLLKQTGYKTACFGKWHLGSAPEYHPNRRGFDEFYGFLAGGRSYFYRPSADDKPGALSCLQKNGIQQHFGNGYLTDVLSEATIRFIETNKKVPFFIYLSYNAVHTPMEATQEDLDRYKDHPRQKLAAMSFAVDRAIGRVVDKLNKEGLWENTLIFFLSDNGGATINTACNEPLKGCKGNKYEGGHRVPFFVVWGDKLKNSQPYDGLTSSLDICATSVAIAGMEMKQLQAPLDGVNIIPFVSNTQKGVPHKKLFWRKNKAVAMRAGNYKLVQLKDFGTRLYNLKEDPEETIDISQRDKKVYRSMLKEMQHWESGLIAPLWPESDFWLKANYEIHQNLMNNKPIKWDSYKKKSSSGKS